MVERLSDDFDFRIVTLDHDFGSDHPYVDMPTDTWTTRGDALVRYVSIRKFGLREVGRILRETPHDVVYLNSFFEPRFTLQILINRLFHRCRNRPVVIAPRGEFSVGALRIKACKKRIFIKLAKILGLYANVTWQASSEWEAVDIRRALSLECCEPGSNGANKVVIASDLAAPFPREPLQLELDPKDRSEGVLRIATLARVTPIKNLDFSLRVLAAVRVPVSFVIYGPIEDVNYWAQCRALINQLPPNIDVVQFGPLDASAVVAELAHYDLFLLPTRGENFGHVIHEALEAGLPVLISDQTPWRRLEEQGVGWDLPLDDMSGYVRRIEEVADWSKQERSAYSARARALALDVSDDRNVLESNRRLFLDAMARSCSAPQSLGT